MIYILKRSSRFSDLGGSWLAQILVGYESLTELGDELAR